MIQIQAQLIPKYGSPTWCDGEVVWYKYIIQCNLIKQKLLGTNKIMFQTGFCLDK